MQCDQSRNWKPSERCSCYGMHPPSSAADSASSRGYSLIELLMVLVVLGLLVS